MRRPHIIVLVDGGNVQSMLVDGIPAASDVEVTVYDQDLYGNSDPRLPRDMFKKELEHASQNYTYMDLLSRFDNEGNPPNGFTWKLVREEVNA